MEIRIVAPQTRCPACFAVPLTRCRDVSTGREVDRVHRLREERCAEAMERLICDHEMTRPERDRTKSVFAAAVESGACIHPGCGETSTRHLSYGLEVASRIGGDPLDYLDRR